MKTNQAGIDLIKSFESCSLTPYKCPAGIWTIGWGHTEDVKPEHRMTQHQADIVFSHDLSFYEEGVTKALAGVLVTENQFSAMVSLAYNIGVNAFLRSSALRNVRAGDMATAAKCFGAWVRGGGKVLPGLVRRREAERILFETP